MLLLLVIFLAMSGYVASSLAVDYTEENESDDYISGGSEAVPYQFPWMVRIDGGFAQSEYNNH